MLWLLGRGSLSDRTVLLDGQMIAEAGGIADAAAVMGALVETISGADGTAWRFASGLLICSHQINLGSRIASGAGSYADPYRTANATWTFPAVFSGVPSVTATCVTAGGPNQLSRAQAIAIGNVTTTQATQVAAYATSAAVNDLAVTAMMIAVGTWAP